MLLGSVEAGGTKFVVGIGDENGNIIKKSTFLTTDPISTVEKTYNFFKDEKVEAIGIASFGPVDLDKNSKTYGYITNTPKIGWDYFNLLGYLKDRIDIPMAFDTDVNASVLAEVKYGSAKGLDSALYLTIGTGVGGGAIVEGNVLHGLLHPEMGHILLRVRSDDKYK